MSSKCFVVNALSQKFLEWGRENISVPGSASTSGDQLLLVKSQFLFHAFIVHLCFNETVHLCFVFPFLQTWTGLVSFSDFSTCVLASIRLHPVCVSLQRSVGHWDWSADDYICWSHRWCHESVSGARHQAVCVRSLWCFGQTLGHQRRNVPTDLHWPWVRHQRHLCKAANTCDRFHTHIIKCQVLALLSTLLMFCLCEERKGRTKFLFSELRICFEFKKWLNLKKKKGYFHLQSNTCKQKYLKNIWNEMILLHHISKYRQLTVSVSWLFFSLNCIYKLFFSSSPMATPLPLAQMMLPAGCLTCVPTRSWWFTRTITSSAVSLLSHSPRVGAYCWLATTISTATSGTLWRPTVQVRSTRYTHVSVCWGWSMFSVVSSEVDKIRLMLNWFVRFLGFPDRERSDLRYFMARKASNAKLGFKPSNTSYNYQW